MCRLAYDILLVLLGIGSVLDLKRRVIPIYLLLLMSAAVFFIALFDKEVSLWYRLAGASLGVIFFGISKFTKEAVGYGDSWIILLLGIALGIFEVLQVLFTASLVAAVVGLLYLWIRQWKRSATLPFVPFLTLAYIGVMFG